MIAWALSYAHPSYHCFTLVLLFCSFFIFGTFFTHKPKFNPHSSWCDLNGVCGEGPMHVLKSFMCPPKPIVMHSPPAPRSILGGTRMVHSFLHYLKLIISIELLSLLRFYPKLIISSLSPQTTRDYFFKSDLKAWNQINWINGSH